MQKKEITKLIKQQESEIFERKKSLVDQDRITEIVSSFANTRGGKILIGVHNTGKILGVDIGNQTIERLTNKVVDNIEPRIYPEISSIQAEGKGLILISVKVGEHKPHTADGRAFKRVGKNTKLMSQSEYERLLMEKNRHKMQFDTEICNGASIKEDISKIKIRHYLEKKQKARNISNKIKISFEQLLTNLRCLKDGKPTNAGILFFGKYPQRFMTNARLRVIKFKGNDIINPTLDSATCEGTLPEMVELSEDFVKKYIRLLGKRTAAKSFRREDKFEYPIDAIREAIVNSLIHRNYFETGDVRVFIFDNRIEIISPGTFPEEVSLKKPQHKPVNDILCQLTYDIGLIEKYGSGIKMMKSLSKEWGNKEPYYELTPIESKIIFESPIEESTYRDVDHLKGLNERQRKAIDYLNAKGKMTTQEYIQITNTSIRTAKRDLKELKDKKVIEYIGSLKTGYYRIMAL